MLTTVRGHRDGAAPRLDRRTGIHGLDDGLHSPHARKSVDDDEIVAAQHGCEVSPLRHHRAQNRHEPSGGNAFHVYDGRDARVGGEFLIAGDDWQRLLARVGIRYDRHVSVGVHRGEAIRAEDRQQLIVGDARRLFSHERHFGSDPWIENELLARVFRNRCDEAGNGDGPGRRCVARRRDLRVRSESTQEQYGAKGNLS